MAKKKDKPKPEDIETVPDAWERFENAIGRMVPPRKKPNKSTNKEGGKDQPTRPSHSAKRTAGEKAG